jgi:asparagine synthetase A
MQQPGIAQVSIKVENWPKNMQSAFQETTASLIKWNRWTYLNHNLTEHESVLTVS